MRLENAPFTSYADGRKSWSLRAHRIALERMAGASLTNIQSANLERIREGVLYASSDASSGASAPAARFQADQGRYALGETDPIPDDLALLYAIQWQFRLTGNVHFVIQNGDRLRAPSLTILEMRHRASGKLERRILCTQGAQVFLQGVRIQCNRVRYDPAGRTLECLEGVRGTFQEGQVQAERLFWSHEDSMLRCPDTAAGALRGMPFQATGLTVDLRQRIVEAEQVAIQVALAVRPAGKENNSMANRRIRPILASALALSALTGSAPRLAGQNPPTKPERAAGETPSRVPTKFGRLLVKNWKHFEKTQTGTGRAFRYTEEEMTMTGDQLRYDEKQSLYWAEGNLVLENPEQRITAKKAEVENNKKKLAILTENVVIVLKPKEKKTEPGAAPAKEADASQQVEGQEARSAGVTITCDRVDHYYKKKQTVLTGNLVFKQRIQREDGKMVERTLTAQRAEYDGKEEKMKLFKPVAGKDSEGREIKFGSDVLVGTKEGEETLETEGESDLITPINEEEEAMPPRGRQ